MTRADCPSVADFFEADALWADVVRAYQKILYYPSIKTNVGGSMSCDTPTPKFNVGDRVSIEATVTKASRGILSDSFTTVTIDGDGRDVDVFTRRFTLVKKAVPPRPPAGSILRGEGVTYVIDPDGMFHCIRENGSTDPSFSHPGGWETAHDKVTLVYKNGS